MFSPNAFADVALLLWAPVCLAAFGSLRPPLACAVLMIAATMILPVGVAFDVDGLPPLGREQLTCIYIILGGLIRGRGRLTSAHPGRGLEILVLVLMVGAIATAATNQDPLVYGPLRLPPVSIKDGISDAIRDLLQYALPFFIGRAFFRSSRDLRDLFRVIAVAGLLYTLPIIVELRLSPQLHRWTYGFFQHGFSSTVRYGGYRPMVYMANGLALTLFMATACLANTALTKAMRSIGRSGAVLGLPGYFRTPYLLVMLVMCKSIASVSYGVIGSTLIASLKPRMLMRVALVLTVIVMAYPMMRATDTFPVTRLLDVIRSVDAERSQSLEFRFRNEDALLEKVRERSAFGWGGFSRARIFDDRGIDRSVTDGYWIIMLGARGVLGLACTFGLLVIPVALAYRRLSSIASLANRTLVATLALIIAIHMVDLMPNGLFSYLPVFFSGALMGVLGGLKRTSGRPRRSPQTKRPSVAVGSILDAPPTSGEAASTPHDDQGKSGRGETASASAGVPLRINQCAAKCRLREIA